MQARHTDRKCYFEESAQSSTRYYLPYILQYHSVSNTDRILEVGCGEGGNLKPFAQKGCVVTGIDMANVRIEQAKRFFKEEGLVGNFICHDFMTFTPPVHYNDKYSIIILHDVIEHVVCKENLIKHISCFLRPDGILFVAFPAWYMPFGGHQQICRNAIWSKMPYFHLLPTFLYRFILEKCAHEEPDTVAELLYIKRCKMPIEQFETLAHQLNMTIINRQLWLVNPHYLQKFGLKPRKLCYPLSATPYVRNFFSTSCFYLLKNKA